MKIFHLLKHSMPGNGHVHVAVDLAAAQAAAGHEVHFVSGKGKFDELLTTAGVKTHVVPETSGGIGTIAALLRLSNLVRNTRPDVVHAHMMSSAVVGYVASRVSGARLVTTVHNSFDAHSSLMRLGDIIVAVSDTEKELLVDRGFARSKLVTVPNGTLGSVRDLLPRVDIGPLFQPAIMTLSGLHARKSVDTAILAFQQLHRIAPRWHLNIVGGGPQEDELRSLAQTTGLLDTKIHFIGGTPTPQYLLDQAEIFVSTSIAEPSGLNIIEARTRGCAIVATDVGGIPENLDRGKSGILFPPQSPHALATALTPLVTDQEMLRHWQILAGENIERFHVSKVADAYITAYKAAKRRPRVLRPKSGR